MTMAIIPLSLHKEVEMIEINDKIKELFLLISGQGEEYLPLIRAAVLEVEGMLKEGADKTDERLEFLIAAVANLYYTKQDCAKLKPYASTVGDLSAKSGADVRIKAAEELAEGFSFLCRGLLADMGDGFYFCTTGADKAAERTLP